MARDASGSQGLGLGEATAKILTKGGEFLRETTTVRTNQMLVNDEVDINAPHREAAMFYGLFLRGHSAERLRRDIDVPQSLLEKWNRHNAYQEDMFQENIRRMVEYRKRVLQIFDELVSNRPPFPGIQ